MVRLTSLLLLLSCERFTARYTTGDIVVTPAFITVAPGDNVTLRAEGCDGACRFVLTPGSGDDASIDDAGRYVAGSRGPAEDVVDVSDRRGQSVRARISVSASLALSPRAVRLAPGQSLIFAAGGGKPPYQFSAESGGIDSLTGAYLATGAGGTVTVVDSNGKSANAIVTIGDALSARLESPAVAPGVANKLLVEGGAAPYTFSFAPKGNRSWGRIDAITGDYVPGGNVLTTDLLRVEDATGARVDVVVHLPSSRITVGRDFGDQCVSADLNGDRKAEVIALNRRDRVAKVFDATGELRALQSALSVNEFPWSIAVGDADDDGRSDIVLGTNYATYAFAGTPLGLSGGGKIDLPYAALFQAPVAMLDNLVYTWTNDYAGVCGAVGQTLIEIDLEQGVVTQCVAATGVRDLDLTDMDADGDLDLVMLHDNGQLIDVFLQHDFTQRKARLPTAGAFERLTPVVTPSGSVGAIAYASGELRGMVCDTTCAALDVGPAVIPNAMNNYLGGEAPTVPRPGAIGPMITWNGLDGRVYGVDVNGAAATLRAKLVTDFALQMDCIAPGDADGDGVEDLTGIGYVSPDAPVLLGEADGTYGRRARFLGMIGPAFADFDGDGVTDVVALDAGGDIVTFLGDDHQLAFADSVTTSAPPLSMIAGPFAASGTAVLTIGNLGDLTLRDIDAAGTIGPARELSITGATGFPSGLMPIELGGAAPGPDLLTRDASGANYRVVVRDSETQAHVTQVVSAPTASGTQRIAAVDLDHDGDPDLVAAGRAGNGSWCFARSFYTSGAFGAWDEHCYDLHAQGRVLMLLADASGRAIAVARVQDDFPEVSPREGKLFVIDATQITESALPLVPTTARLGTLNDDAHDDLLLADKESSRVVLRAGDGNGGYDTLIQDLYATPAAVGGTARMASGAAHDIILNDGDRMVFLRRTGATFD